MYEISDVAIDCHYSRDYCGDGTDYFYPPEDDEEFEGVKRDETNDV